MPLLAWLWRPVMVMVVLLASASPTAAAIPDPLTPEERAWAEDHGPIRYAPDPDYPPFEFLDVDGQPTGINFDFLNRMSRNLHVEFEVVLLPTWGAVLDAMKAGDIDMVGSLAQTEERETYMDFVGPYMQVGEVFYVRSDGPSYDSVKDLVDKRVGVIENYAAGVWLAEHHPELTLVPVPDMASGMERLSVGELDAFFENIPVGSFVIRENAFTNVRIMGEPLYYSPANWGITKDDSILAAIITKGMASISLGDQTAIFEYWTGYDLGIRPASTESISTLWRMFLLGVMGITAIVSIWGFSLRRTVRRRTRELHEMNAQLRNDVARREHAEREVRTLNEQLETRVAERTQQLEVNNADLEQFTYRVSHDLRTPLTSMRTYTQVLSRKYQEQLGEEGRRYIERMEHASLRMAALMDDVLRLSKATRLELTEDEVDLGALVRRSIDELSLQEPERHVRVDVAQVARAHGDARLLELLVSNLVQNAWKYTRKTEDATIVFGMKADSECPVYFLQDNGVGFPSAKADRLFQAFSRLHDDSDFEGTGIGLSTVRRIAERHGGKAWAQSEPGRGATFFFTLNGGNA